MGCSKNSFKKEGHNDVSLPQETRKIPNVTYLPKQLEKRKKKKKKERPNLAEKKKIQVVNIPNIIQFNTIQYHTISYNIEHCHLEFEFRHLTPIFNLA